MLIFTSFSRIFRGIFSGIGTFFFLITIFAWDGGLTIMNLITPKRKVGQAIDQGKPGAGGIWPEYIAPKEGDSRSSCPGLNTLANHGIIPRDGKNIPFKLLTEIIYDTFRFAPSFCYFTSWYAAQFLQRDYKTGTLNLNDLDVHNCIEHDASLTRWDAKQQPDQSKPALDLTNDFLACATGGDGKILTAKDVSKFLEMRRAFSKAHNTQFTLSTGQRLFSSANSTTLLIFFGGIIDDIRTFLTEERFPDGWETKVRSRNGLTIASINRTANTVEFGINEKRAAKMDNKAPEPPKASEVASATNGESAV